MTWIAFSLLAACSDYGVRPMNDASADAADTGVGAIDDDVCCGVEPGPIGGDGGSPGEDSDPGGEPIEADDTGGADSAPPADDFEGSGDSRAPEDTGGSPCRELSFSWVAPSVGSVVEVHGELSDPDSGTILLGWSTHAHEEDTHRVSATLSVCTDFTWRGQGAADLDGDGAFDMWSCQRQSTEEIYAVVGEVTCAVEGEPLEVVITPDDWSDGCGVSCTWRR